MGVRLNTGNGGFAGHAALLASGNPASEWGEIISVTLADSIDNYKFIQAMEYNAGDGNAIASAILPVSLFKDGINPFAVYAPGGTVAAGVKAKYTDATHAEVFSYGYTGYRIYGIK